MKKYNIVQLGAGEEYNGLLKSINEDGSWEGTVYLTPFHAKVNVESLREEKALQLTDKPLKFDQVSELNHGGSDRN